MPELYVDGGCSGNGQRDLARRQMVMVVTDAAGVVLSERQESGGSNNIAELLAVRDAVRWSVAAGLTEVVVWTDSRNNLAWVNGRTVGKAINDRARVVALKAEIAEARQWLRLTLMWLPRAVNKAGQYIERQHGS